MQLQAQEGLLFTYRSGLSSRGLLAWVVALGLTAFYLALYFTEIFTPLALALGLPSKWTLYGALYTLVMIGGEMVRVAGPVDAPESASAVTTNCCNTLVRALVFAFTMYTLAMVKTSPALWMPVMELDQPSVISDCVQVFLAVS